MGVMGYELVARALQQQGVDTFFFIMGAPMSSAEKAAIDRGIRGIDVRHEQAAAMMAHAYGRIRNRPGVCMACSGPGTLNFGTGLATACYTSCPWRAGWAPAIGEYGRGAFQNSTSSCDAPPGEMGDRITRPGASRAGQPHSGRHSPASPVGLSRLSERRPYASRRGRGGVASRSAGVARPCGVRHWLKAVELLSAHSGPSSSRGAACCGRMRRSAARWIDHAGLPLYTTPQGRASCLKTIRHAPAVHRPAADVVLVVGARLLCLWSWAGAALCATRDCPHRYRPAGIARRRR